MGCHLSKRIADAIVDWLDNKLTRLEIRQLKRH